MKMNVFIPGLYPYRMKFVGIVFLALSVLYFIVVEIAEISIYQDIKVIKWSILTGLTIITFSKEKNENSSIKNIRIIALYYAFVFIVSLTIAYHLVIYVFGLSDELGSLDLILMGLVLNTIFYYSVKWLGPKEVQLNYKNMIQIIKDDKLLILIWSILTFSTIWLLLIL